MKKPVNYFLVTFAAAVAVFSTACSSDSSSNGGSGGGGNSTGGGGSSDSKVALTPNDTGWVDKGSNSLGIQGAWYPYGDSFAGATPTGSCNDPAKGNHKTEECSKVTKPDPAAGKFVPDATKGMCTEGTVAMVLAMDYANMWGAGIGLDFGAPDDATTGATKKAVDLSGAKGVSFDLDQKPVAGLRVELPQPSTEGGTNGSNYWGADSTWPNSPVKAGNNTIMWADFKAPGSGTTVTDPKAILGLQFHVPTTTSAAGTFSFCVNNLTILK